MIETPSYIKALLKPNGKQASGKRVWSIDLETVWLPFFYTTNLSELTAIPLDSLGAPIRLAYTADGSVKFTKSGRPATKVVKDISDSVKMVKENFIANLISFANTVRTENPDGYNTLVRQAQEAGAPIRDRDRQNLDNAIAKQREAELMALLKGIETAEAKGIEAAEAKPKGKKGDTIGAKA
jgi:hypothetical protein